MVIGKALSRSISRAVLLVFFSFATSGCQLFVLPVIIVASVFQLFIQLLNYAIIIPIKLLPIALKYAPLALMLIDSSAPEPIYYVEWLDAHQYPYDYRSIVNGQGEAASVIISDTEYMAEYLSEGHTAVSEGTMLLLTEDVHRNVGDEELEKTWNLLKQSKESIWLVGKPVDAFRNHRDVSYL